MAEKTPSGSNCFFAAQRRAPLVPYAKPKSGCSTQSARGCCSPAIA